jgi:hypothetical protein
MLAVAGCLIPALANASFTNELGIVHPYPTTTAIGDINITNLKIK